MLRSRMAMGGRRHRDLVEGLHVSLSVWFYRNSLSTLKSAPPPPIYLCIPSVFPRRLLNAMSSVTRDTLLSGSGSSSSENGSSSSSR